MTSACDRCGSISRVNVQFVDGSWCLFGCMLFLISLMLTPGCASTDGIFGDTVGDKFREALSNVDSYCRERKIGPYLDRSDPEYRRKSPLTNCDILNLKPFDLNAVLATPEGKFAYSIQLPPPLDRPRVKRTDFLAGEDYFQALCQKEVVEIVFAEPKDASGIAFLRTPLAPWGHYSLGSYSEESAIGRIPPDPELLLLHPNKRLRFVERMVVRNDERKKFPDAKFLRFERDPSNPNKLVAYPIDKPSATYGYVFRGTEAFNDRESGVWGGEAILIETTTGKVLGVRRSFGRDRVDTDYKDRVRRSGRPCPGEGGRSYSDFIWKVFSPIK